MIYRCGTLTLCRVTPTRRVLLLAVLANHYMYITQPDYYRDASHFRRVGAGPEYRCEIPHAKLDYTGAYSVVARNEHGEAKAIISLQILAKGKLITIYLKIYSN